MAKSEWSSAASRFRPMSPNMLFMKGQWHPWCSWHWCSLSCDSSDGTLNGSRARQSQTMVSEKTAHWTLEAMVIKQTVKSHNHWHSQRPQAEGCLGNASSLPTGLLKPHVLGLGAAPQTWGPELDPWNLCKRLGMEACACNPSAAKAEIGASLGLAGHPSIPDSR